MRFLTIALAGCVALAADSRQPADFFEMKVRAVLAKNCFSRHTASKMGGLEMTSRDGLVRGGNSGPAIRAGDPNGSLMIQAARHMHARLKMPAAGKLTDDEMAALAAWVREGAPWPEHAALDPKPASAHFTPEQRDWWAFQPVRKPDPPPVRNSRWARTPLDRFILAALEAKGLQPVGPADRRTLIRRASFDLTGLPPSPEEVDAFLRDRSPDAFAKVVERLLASPRYGKRWGRYWLDLARYSDDQLNSTRDEPQPNVWRYRDWVIAALNDDMPYDQFVPQQVETSFRRGRRVGMREYAV